MCVSTRPFLSRMRSRVQAFNVEHSPVQRVLAWLSVVLSLMVTRLLPACKTITQRIRYHHQVPSQCVCDLRELYVTPQGEDSDGAHWPQTKAPA